jgi:hypothetical protein
VEDYGDCRHGAFGARHDDGDDDGGVSLRWEMELRGRELGWELGGVVAV